MSKNAITTTEEIRTMETVLKELNDSVDAYNLSGDAVERVQLELKHKELVEEYNELSLLSSYADFMKEELPLVALGKAYTYATISTKDAAHKEVIDGVKKSIVTRSVNEGEKLLNITKFLDWAAERNKHIAASKDWKTKMGDARDGIITQWKKFFAAKGDTHKVSISQTKKVLQAMLDALVFVPTEGSSDKNAYIVDGDIAKFVFAFANTRKVGLVGNVMANSTWQALQMDLLHKIVTKKDITIVYGDPEEEEAEAEAPAAEEAASK